MKHPAPEEWMAWLYGEVAGVEKQALKTHLDGCEPCRSQVAGWRDTMRVLDEMPAPVAGKRFRAIPLQWVAAAALLIGLGIVLGRLAFPAGDAHLTATMRQQIDAQVATARAELARDFERRQTEFIAQMSALTDAKISSNAERLSAEFAKTLEETRMSDRQTYLLALREVGAKYENEIANLRKGLEAVVTLADYGFEATEQRLAQLVASTQSSPE